MLSEADCTVYAVFAQPKLVETMLSRRPSEADCTVYVVFAQQELVETMLSRRPSEANCTVYGVFCRNRCEGKLSILGNP